MRKLFMVLLALLLVPIALLLVGCSPISSGTITNKAYEAAHYYTTTTCHLVGKVNVCSPHTTYDDPDWRFDIREGDKNGWVYVSEQTFNEYAVGDYYRGEN